MRGLNGGELEIIIKNFKKWKIFFVRKYSSLEIGQMAGNDVCLQSGNHPEKEIGAERSTSVSSGGNFASGNPGFVCWRL